MPGWRSRLRLRNCVNKCRMSNERSQHDDRNPMSRGMLIVVSSPSGGGKGTLIDRVLKTVPNVSYSVSFTTRAPRPPKQDERERAAGHDIILEIDVQGAENIRHKVPDAVSIFILPPSFELLRHRLLARGTDSADALEKRMRGEPREVEQYKYFQYVILNDDINRASQQLASVIYAERARHERQELNVRRALEDFGVFEDAQSEPDRKSVV